MRDRHSWDFDNKSCRLIRDAEFVCEVPRDAEWTVFADGSVIVASPSVPPFRMTREQDGWRKTIIEPKKD